MPHDPGDRVLVVREHRATFQAAGFDAVMAGGGDGLLDRLDPVAAGRFGHEEFSNERPDLPPRFAVVEAVEGMTGGHARLAAAAAVEVHFEGVLFAGPG